MEGQISSDMSTRESRIARTASPGAVPRTGAQEEFKAYGRAGALRPLSAQRLLERGHVVLPSTVRSRVKAGGGNGPAGGRQAQVVEDRLHRPVLREVGEHDVAAAARTGEHVIAEDAPQELGPCVMGPQAAGVSR